MLLNQFVIMEQVILTYDAQNPLAQKTLDYLISLGIFKVEKTKSAKLSKEEKAYLENLKKIVPSVKEQALKKDKKKSLQSLINEL